MKPNTNEHVTAKQSGQKLQHDKHVKLRSLFPGTSAMVRDFCGLGKWVPGVVFKKLGPVSYSVETAHGRIVKRHIDHLTLRKESPQDATTPNGIQPDSTVLDNYQYPTVEEPPVPQDSPEPEQSVPGRCPRGSIILLIVSWLLNGEHCTLTGEEMRYSEHSFVDSDLLEPLVL